MAASPREYELAKAFVSLADTLVADYDVLELLQNLVDTSVHLLDASAGGLLLSDDFGSLALVASTSEESDLVELLQIESGQGPCMASFRSGEVVEVAEIATSGDEWPEFRDGALAQGFAAVLAVPLRLRDNTIGTLNLFRTEVGPMDPADIAIARGLADIATIGILHERTVRESHAAREQLQHALNSRVVIEQAKGVIAQLHAVDMDEAFRTLREYSRNNNVPLRDVAELVVRRSISL